jgi:hypothetical protein
VYEAFMRHVLYLLTLLLLRLLLLLLAGACH